MATRAEKRRAERERRYERQIQQTRPRTREKRPRGEYGEYRARWHPKKAPGLTPSR